MDYAVFKLKLINEINSVEESIVAVNLRVKEIVGSSP